MSLRTRFSFAQPLIDEGTGKVKSQPLIRAWAKITGYIGGGKPYTEGHKEIHKEVPL